jgi:hypothetical protein
MALVVVAPAVPQIGLLKARIASKPRLEPIAEISVLMKGINLPNLRGLDRELRQRPTSADAWSNIRGQALLIAENGNLLMLRPPRKLDEETWLARARDLRTVAAQLSESAAARDHEHSVAGLKELANACNRCHQFAKVDVQITSFADEQPGLRYAPPSPLAVPEPPEPPKPPAPPRPPSPSRPDRQG